MKLINKSILIAALAATVIFTSCDGDEDSLVDRTDVPNQLEEFDLVEMTLNDGTTDYTFEWEDDDEDGENDHAGETPELAANTTYTVSFKFFGEHGDHEDEDEEHDNERSLSEDDDHDDEEAEDITSEIESEDTDHLIFYVLSDDDLATITYEGSHGLDRSGKEFGLTAKLVTGAANSGRLRVVMIHEPTKQDNGSNTLENVGGETDIDIKWDFVVK